MRSKLSWIAFVPLALLAGYLRLAPSMTADGTAFGFTARKAEYLFLAVIALIFVCAFVFCLIDRRIAQYYLPRWNPAAGVCGLLLALLLAADGSNNLMHMVSADRFDALSLVDALLSLLSAVVFVVFGLNHCARTKGGKRFSLLNVIPAMLCAVRMILSFVSFTTISIRMADISSLICYVFATMFFYYFAVSQSLIKTKTAVKAMIIFGMPAAAALIPYGVYRVVFCFDSDILLDNIQPIQMLLLGLYILSFLIEMTIFAKDKDSVTIILDDEPAPDVSEEKVQGFLANSINEDENDTEVTDDAVLEQRDTEGFLYQEYNSSDDEPEKNEEMEKEVQNYLTDMTEVPDDIEEIKRTDYDDRLDDIDKLIIEINNQSD